jgi:ATP-binding protein involved in chromosome partitioning
MVDSSVNSFTTLPQLIGIAAGKGGVGKSTLTVNLALALQHCAAKVGIIDADLYGPSIRHMLPEERAPAQGASGKIIPAISHGLAYISIDFLYSGNNHSALIRAPIANRLIKQFIEEVEWGELDYLLIDFPPGTGDIQLTLAQQAGLAGAILVTWPQPLSLIDVRKAADLFSRANVPILGIVENMYGLFPGQAGEILAEESGAPLLLQIPFAEKIDGDPLFAQLAAMLPRLLGRAAPPSTLQCTLRDPHTLYIEWLDGKSTEIPLSKLQAECPCARCREADRSTRAPIAGEVAADQVVPVGNYAVKIQFSSGCAKGIYSFDMLRKWRSYVHHE